jgi:hypothetical protein
MQRDLTGAESVDEQYETAAGYQHKPLVDETEGKRNSAQPDSDPLDAVSGTGPAGMPAEVVAADLVAADIVPKAVMNHETQAVDFMTPEGRPRDFRPREYRY